MSHFEAFAPVCPLCRLRQARSTPLRVGFVAVERGDVILEGALHCSDPDCAMEYPIIDGIPLLVPDVRRYVTENIAYLNARDDLSPYVESLLGDCAGPESHLDSSRRYTSSYAWDHYGDLDPDGPQGGELGDAMRCLSRGLSEIDDLACDRAIEIGCAAGRGTFTLAEETGGLALGLDLDVPMLRVASRVLHTGVARYPLRRVGLVYDRRAFPVEMPGAERVDFWAADALALPLPAEAAGLAVALNVLDCVRSPVDLLAGIEGVLAPGGHAVLTTPFDWSVNATPAHAWIGGHSQRGPGGGASAPLLRALLTPGALPQSTASLECVAEVDAVPWRVRLHDRQTVHYQAHLVVARRRG